MEWLSHDSLLKLVSSTSRHRLGWRVVRFQGGVESPLLGYPMKKTAVVLGSAVFSLGTCAALVWLSIKLGISVRFPSPSGEDDFSQRAAYFLFGVCPAFLLLGAWIGYAGYGSARKWLAMWGGALGGAASALVGAFLMQAQVERLSGDGVANRAVLVFYGAWVALSVLGAVVAQRLVSK